MAWYWWLFSPLIAYLIVLLICDLIAFYRTIKYKKQGFFRKYVPVLGQASTFLPNKKYPHDGMRNFKDTMALADKAPGLVMNDTRGVSAIIYLTDLDLIKEFFLKESTVSKRAIQEDLKFNFSFFYDNSERSLNQRRVFSELFKIDNITAVIPILRDVTQKHFGTIRQKLEKSTENVLIDFKKMDVDILKDIADRVLFGSKDEVPYVMDGKKTHITDFVFDTIKLLTTMKAVLNPLNLLLFGYPNRWNLLSGSRQAAKNAVLVNEAIKRYHDERANDPNYHLGVNILDLMIKHNKNCTNPEDKFTIIDIIGDLVLFLFAGSDSTSKALSTCIYLLAKHPDYAERVRKETKEKVLTADPVKFEDLDKCETLNAVVSEALRLYSPAPATFDKLLVKDFTLGKYQFYAGDKIVIPFAYTSNSTRFFPEGETFNPDHFIGENAKKIPQMAHIPFSSGKRGCLGRFLAEAILKMSIVELLSTCRLSVADDDVNGWSFSVGYDIEHCNVRCAPL